MSKDWYVVKDAKDLINTYIAEHELEREVKRGHIRLDPQIVRLVGDCKPGQNDVKKEYLYKNLMGNLTECHVITMLDEDLVVRDSQKLRFVKGPVPRVTIFAEKLNNKKVTTIIGLEVFQIDQDEL